MGIFDKMKGQKPAGAKYPFVNAVQGESILRVESMVLTENRTGAPMVRTRFLRVAAKGEAADNLGEGCTDLYFPTRGSKFQDSDNARFKALCNAVAGVGSQDTDTTDAEWVEAATAGEGDKHAGALVLCRVVENKNGNNSAYFETIEGAAEFAQAAFDGGKITDAGREMMEDQGFTVM